MKTTGIDNRLKPLFPGTDFNTLEEFGGNSFYKIFWGRLTYQSINDSTSKVTYEGNENVFDGSFEGKWLEPSRVHKCSFEYPETGRNYFPGAFAVVYSRVLEVVDGKNLIVDFSYNGGQFSQIKPISNQDGIFFFDNKFAIESWANAAQRKSMLMANEGQIYASLGIPRINISPDTTLSFAKNGEGERPAIHVMMSDAFNGDRYGRGEGSPDSFRETFGENGIFFNLPGEGRVDIDFDWQYIPPVYSQVVVQYGVPNGAFFFDDSPLSSQYGLKRVSNFDQFRIRREMKKSLGFVRPGVSFSMPNQGYCNGGGIHDGRDVTEFCTYRFEGDWVSKDPNNMKARTNGGLRVEWIGKSKEELGSFIEMESLKAFRYDNLKFRFLSPSRIEVDDPNFTWYNLASQEWTGGASTSNEITHLVIEGKQIGLNTNGDFWLVNGDEDLKGRHFGTHQLNLFDKIPFPGAFIFQNLEDLGNSGLIGKVSDTVFEIWGWSIQANDLLSFSGKTFTVKSIARKSKTWEQFASQYPFPQFRLKRGDRFITYTEIQLDKPIIESLPNIRFRVERSALQGLLDGEFRSNCSAIWSFGNEAPGHLMYTDYNVNLILKNVKIHGLIRSTSRQLWAETTRPLTGLVSSIPVGNIDSIEWKKGDKLQLSHPESGKTTEVELVKNYSGNLGFVEIKPIVLTTEFPEKSVLVGLFSLCSETRFENVFFVNEDLSPSYSERIDYRPQGLRLRQLITKNANHRIKIKGGRISWYSNMENRFEPEIEFSEHTHLVNTKSVVPVLLNPIISDRKGIYFGYQFKEVGKEEIFILNRIVARNSASIDLTNSKLGSDLYMEGNGKVILDNVVSKNFIDNGRNTGVGFNVVLEDKFTTSKSMIVEGKSGESAFMVNSKYPIGVIRIVLKDWKLKPGLFNATGFQTKQETSDPRYKEFVRISD